MSHTALAAWLDTSFAGFDHFFLNIHHVLGDKLGVVLTPIMKTITFLGEKGWIFFLLALIFMLMADKRDLGVCIFGAVCCGALITNIILKDNVARLRPFVSSFEYGGWWSAIGSPAEDGFSFPSGHVTACAAGMTAITLMRGKKWIVPSVVVVLLMCISRNYLMAHYPSDVLAAVIIGVFSGIVAWFITQLIFRFLNRRRKTVPVCAALLDFDIRDVLPFQLPVLSGGRGRQADAASRRVRRADPADEDVKTYPAAGKRGAAPAEGDEDVRIAAPARSTRRTRPAEEVPAEEKAPAAEKTPAPTIARHVAPSRSGGRHALVDSGAAKKPARTRSPGGYQGKH